MPEGGRVAALPDARRIDTEVLPDPERRDLDWIPRVGDVDDPGVSAAEHIACAARRRCIGQLAERDAHVREGPTEVGAMPDLELVDSARAASGVVDAEGHWACGIRDVPKHEPTRDRQVEARAARLESRDRDVPSRKRS